MSSRDRQATGGLSATVTTPAPSSAASAPPRHIAVSGSGDAATTGVARTSLWEDVFRSATPAQQQHLLELAARQGVVHAHQLPQPTNGTRNHADDTRGLHLLSHLLAGQTAELTPLPAAPIEFHDGALDRQQREAVRRATATADVCLIRGGPGTGKSRVVAEIVTQAACRGERVLLLAPGAAGVDRVLDLLAGRDAVCSLRLLAPDERAESLPPAARAATFPERTRSIKEDSARAARVAREAAEDQCQQRRHEEPLWPRLEGIAGALTRLGARAAELSQSRARIGDEVNEEAASAEATQLRQTLERAEAAGREAVAKLAAALSDAESKRSEQQRRALALRAEAEGLRPLAEAKQRGRWWSPTWWRAAFRGDVASKLAEAESAQASAAAELTRLDDEVGRLARDRAEAESAALAQRDRCLSEEVERRDRAIAGQLAALEAERAEAEKEWHEAVARIAAADCRPAAPTAEAVGAGREAWAARQKADEQRCAFARQWASYLESSADGLAARLPGLANLVAAPAAALPASDHFADPAAAGGQFDLLILEEADLLTEADLLKLCRRARRWVLIGDPLHSPDDAGARRPGHRPGGLGRANVFNRLWQTLHCDPSRLPYSWGHEQGRLSCRLRQLPPEQRQWLESERVADHPDIELRILALPRVVPLLAEVLFPPSMTALQAKEYIYRELQELPVQALGAALDWVEDGPRLTALLAPEWAGDGESLALESGLREVLVSADGRAGRGVYTARLEFDSTVGWDRPKAEAWVATHLGLRDLGRTAVLERQHRMAPSLAAVVADLLGHAARSADHADGAAVEFVAVPAVTAPREAARGGRDGVRRREGGGTAVRAEPRSSEPAIPKAGAGLEQDLAASRHADRLPNDLRAHLPSRGVVNYLEAEAVVRKLEELAHGGRGAGPVAVVAMQPAQAELIRLLAGRSARLAGSGLEFEVGAPHAFCHREFATALVSLTRSHGHRAVTFCESVCQLALALTRARQRLIVFGDVGTLARRSQWHGVLDHLDEAAAAREAQLAARLCTYVQGRGRSPRAFRLCEGSGA